MTKEEVKEFFLILKNLGISLNQIAVGTKIEYTALFRSAKNGKLKAAHRQMIFDWLKEFNEGVYLSLRRLMFLNKIGEE